MGEREQRLVDLSPEELELAQRDDSTLYEVWADATADSGESVMESYGDITLVSGEMTWPRWWLLQLTVGRSLLWHMMAPSLHTWGARRH